MFAWPYWWRHWFSPRTYYYWIKFKIQRARRGWADCDTWSLDNYLVEWLPDALRHLKENKHGVPSSMFTEEENSRLDPEGWIGPDEAAMDRAGKKWDGIMDQMIEGFVAYRRADEGMYREELGPYPMCHKKGHFLCDCEPDRTLSWQHLKAQEPLRERDEKLFKDGMALFTEYFGSLWD